MAEVKFAPVKARRIRVTKLDECSEPEDTGGNTSTLVTSGFVKVAGTMEIEDGEEFLKKNAWGEFCINEKDASRIKRMNLELEFCQVQPELLSMIAGVTPMVNGSSAVVGGSIGQAVGTKFQLELWTRIGGSDCDPAITVPYTHWTWPVATNGVLGDLEFSNGMADIMVTANTEGAPSSLGTGLYAADLYESAIPAGDFVAFHPAPAAPPADTDGAVEFTAIP